MNEKNFAEAFKKAADGLHIPQREDGTYIFNAPRRPANRDEALRRIEKLGEAAAFEARSLYNLRRYENRPGTCGYDAMLSAGTRLQTLCRQLELLVGKMGVSRF